MLICRLFLYFTRIRLSYARRRGQRRTHLPLRIMIFEKWYGDVFSGGRLQIYYRANLTLGPVVIGYRGCLSNEGRTLSRISLGGIPLPCIEGGALTWPCDDGTSMVWNNASTRPIELWSDRSKMVTWNPIVLNGNLMHSGARGYAERLTMSNAPWNLGLKLLKWGRFCSEHNNLTWIEWHGSYPLRLALLNAQPVTLNEATRQEVRTSSATLRFHAPRALISETIGSNVLKGWSLPIGRSARAFLRGYETKWLAEAELEIGGMSPDAGHAVFEEVSWE